ncbi:MAG: hypothetical protein K6C94_07645 [Candidatus Gastranaerophilales bacterium]|nr:hypothetical protein [Candidatus Gastranaerophilales bacterium]
MKKSVLIDLDGVLNTYDGNYTENYIPPAKEGAFDFLKNLSENYSIKIFTIREKNLTLKWLQENNLSEYISDVTNTKDLCWVYIDDRCITFEGNYSTLYKKIDEFKPWFKK